jgi:hypothetical protein
MLKGKMMKAAILQEVQLHKIIGGEELLCQYQEFIHKQQWRTLRRGRPSRGVGAWWMG